MVYSGTWGKLIHEENQMSKMSWHCPFKLVSYSNLLARLKTLAPPSQNTFQLLKVFKGTVAREYSLSLCSL